MGQSYRLCHLDTGDVLKINRQLPVTGLCLYSNTTRYQNMMAWAKWTKLAVPPGHRLELPILLLVRVC